MTISPDLTRVAFSQRRGTETILTVASLPNGETLKTWRITSPPYLAHLLWPREGDYLAYVLTDDPRRIGGLWFQPLNAETPRLVADLSGEAIGELAAVAISDDAKNFGVIRGNWKHDAVLLRGLK
jgi:hypothetical protein